MKKTIALLLCLCMLACLFVGCARTSTTEKPTSETTTTETLLPAPPHPATRFSKSASSSR